MDQSTEFQSKMSAPDSPPRRVSYKRKCKHNEDDHTDENSSVPRKKPKVSKERDKPVRSKVKSSSKKGCAASGSKGRPHQTASESKTSSAAACEDGRVRGKTEGAEEEVGIDAIVLQRQLEKEQDEKRKLLSSIEELKSQLATKDRLLAEKDKAISAENLDASVVSSMQEEFRCVICQELFINAFTLPCAHSFCKWCINEWIRRKGHKDCPMCRKRITSKPFHSLALDNAVKNLVRKLSTEELTERSEMEIEHNRALENLPDTYGDSDWDSFSDFSFSDFDSFTDESSSSDSEETESESDDESDSSDSDDSDGNDSVVVPEIVIPDIVIPDIVIPDIVLPDPYEEFIRSYNAQFADPNSDTSSGSSDAD